jgi:hypothetical protein
MLRRREIYRYVLTGKHGDLLYILCTGGRPVTLLMRGRCEPVLAVVASRRRICTWSGAMPDFVNGHPISAG